jgi:hypothetical protein
MPASSFREQQELQTDLQADLRAQERAAADAPKVPVVAKQYIHAVHPEHGEGVVFVPGEALPGWAVDALKAGRGRVTDEGHIVLGGTK